MKYWQIIADGCSAVAISLAKVYFVWSNISAGEDPRGLSPNQSLKTHLENKSEKTPLALAQVSSPCVISVHHFYK